MKIVKRVVIVIVLILMVLLDVFILNNFEDKIVKMGVIDKNENIKVDLKYSLINFTDLFYDYGYMGVFTDDLFGNVNEMFYIDLDGNEYRYFSKGNFYNEKPYFYENRAVVSDLTTGKKGYIDFNNKCIVDFIYDEADSFENGYARVGVYNRNGELCYGVIDSKGNEILTCSYDYISKDYNNFDVFYAEKNEESYIVNNKNIIIAEYTDDEYIKFKNMKDLNSLGFINTEDVFFYKNFIVIRGDNDKFGLYTKEGNKKTDFVFEDFKSISTDESYWAVIFNNKDYIIDNNFNFVIDLDKFNENGFEISEIEANRVKIKCNDKYGITDLKCNIIIKPEYNNVSIQTIDKGYFTVSKDEKHGVFDLNGNEIIKCSDKYKTMIYGNGEYFVVRTTNIKLLVIYISIIVMTVIVAIILVILFFKKSKKII